MLQSYTKIVLVLAFIYSNAECIAQSTITGKVSDQKNIPIPFATVALLNATDSVPIKGTNTNESGEYKFENISAGKYFLKVSSVEFKTSTGSVFDLDSNINYDHVPLLLSPSENILNEVAITAQKKTFEFKNGNITVNIENSPLAIGNSVYDVLSRMPGVMIDNGVISLQGRQGVSIYIDDRIQQISGMQLISLLKAMKASSVEKIEIIKNPSAKYDAAGSAGIINIKTKKLKVTGFSGNVAYTFSKGHGVQNMPDLSLNYKGKKFAFFSSFNLYSGYLKATADLYKTINDGSTTTILNSKSYDTDIGYFGTGNLGLDCFINKKNTLGVKFQAVPGFIVRTKIGNNAVSGGNLGYDNLDYKRTIPNNFYFANYNVNFEHLFDTSGTKLKFSADAYGPYYDVYKSDYQYRFMDNQQNEILTPREYKGVNMISLSILSSRIDFEKKLSKTLNFETGLKASQQAINSEYTFQAKNNQTGVYDVDTSLTNQFVYHEQISAAYINLQKEFQKINIQAGLRTENTNINTSSEIKDFKYSRHYLKLFPSVTINYNSSERHNFSFAYNKRIYRPDYNSFNPYPVFSNLFSLSRGNPYLVPEFSHNFNISHTFKGKLTNTFSYSRSENPIRGQTLQNDSSKVTIFQSGNLQSSIDIHYYIFLNTDVKRWWSLTINLGAYYYDFKGKIGDASLNSSGYSYFAYINNQFVLPKNFKIELSAFYIAPWLEGGFYLYRQRGALNIAVKKSFFNDKLNLSVGLYDMFFSNVAHADVNFQNQHYSFTETYDTRRLNLSLSYNFGKLKVQQRDVKSDEDAKARVKR